MQLGRLVVWALLGLLCMDSGFGRIPDGSEPIGAQQEFTNMGSKPFGVGNCSCDVEDLELRLNTTEEELRKQRVAVDQLKAENHEMQERLNDTEEQIEQLRQKLNSGEIYRGTSTDKTLVFKRVFANAGDCYCPDTGLFTAPVNGLYYFSFSAYGYNTHVVGAILLKNGARQISTYDNLSTDGSDSSGNAVVLQLVAGDKVHMELWEGGQVFDNLNGHTTFSGFLLFPV